LRKTKELKEKNINDIKEKDKIKKEDFPEIENILIKKYKTQVYELIYYANLVINIDIKTENNHQDKETNHQDKETIKKYNDLLFFKDNTYISTNKIDDDLPSTEIYDGFGIGEYHIERI